MANRYALVENDVVVNITLAEPEWVAEQTDRWEPADGVLVGIGWTWVEGQAPVPNETPRQWAEKFKARLIRRLYGNVKDALDLLMRDYHDMESSYWRENRSYLPGIIDGSITTYGRVLTRAITVSNMTAAEYAQGVKDRLDYEDIALGTVLGRRMKIELELNAIDTTAPDAIAQLKAVDLSVI